MKTEIDNEFAELLGTKDLVHDTCQKCGKVLTNEEMKKYGADGENCKCEECQNK